MLKMYPCLDSAEMAMSRRQELDIPRNVAAALGRSAVEAVVKGYYVCRAGAKVDWSRDVHAACSAKVSIPPGASLLARESITFPETQVQVTNETTLGASRRLVERGLKPLALNFANGIHPGGGFLGGARAQEEVLCRSSALYQTLAGDPMYEHHLKRPRPDSTSYCQIWCSGLESSGDLIGSCYLDSIFEFHSSDDFRQIIEPPLAAPVLLGTQAKLEHHMQHPISAQAAL